MSLEGFVGVSVEGLGEEGMPQGSEPTTVYKVWVGNIPTHVVHSNQVFAVSGKEVQPHISHVLGLSNEGFLAWIPAMHVHVSLMPCLVGSNV